MLFLSQEKFGHIPQGKRLERIKQSPNYDGKQFVNEVETVTMTGDRSVFVVWKDFLLGLGHDRSIVLTPQTIPNGHLFSKPLPSYWALWPVNKIGF